MFDDDMGGSEHLANKTSCAMMCGSQRKIMHLGRLDVKTAQKIEGMHGWITVLSAAGGDDSQEKTCLDSCGAEI